MATVSETLPTDHESEENSTPQRPPTRNLRTPRPDINSSSKTRRASVEQRESRDIQSGNKKPKYQPSDKIASESIVNTKSVIEKSLEFEEGVTLDKIFGGNYKKIEILPTSDKNGDEMFPSAPYMNRRSTLHETLELNEIEEEDEENYEGRKRSSQGFSRRERGAGSMSLRVGYDAKSPKMDEKSALPTFESALGSETSSVYVPRRTLTNFYDKVRDEAREDSQTRTTRPIRGSVEMKARKKTVNSQSKSPTPLRKTGQTFYQTKGGTAGKVPIVRPAVGSRRSIDDIKNTIEDSVRNESMHSTFANPFYPKQVEKEIIRNAEFMNEFTKKILPFDAHKARSSNQLDMNDDRFSQKKNKFLYQNAVLQEKIRDEEKMLLSKYCTKFGLNMQEYYGKQALVNTSAQNAMKTSNFDTTKKSFAPFLKETKFGTFYKVGIGKPVFN